MTWERRAQGPAVGRRISLRVSRSVGRRLGRSCKLPDRFPFPQEGHGRGKCGAAFNTRRPVTAKLRASRPSSGAIEAGVTVVSSRDETTTDVSGLGSAVRIARARGSAMR